jgi:subtilisin family serine protease
VGRERLTTGYGDYQIYADDSNQSYTLFSGTSSATPMVAGCAAVLQSAYHQLTGGYLTCQQLRTILIETGTPQGEGGHIGSLPNMEAALENVMSLSVSVPEKQAIVLYPNPANSILNMRGAFDHGNTAIITNAAGQHIRTINLSGSASTCDISDLSSGIYFIKLEGDVTCIKKFVKI